MSIEIFVPDIGDDEVAVTEILVKVGDSVEADQSLLTVEGDKASMEVPSPQAGVVTAIKVALGDKVSTGSLIMAFEVAGGAVAASAPAAEAAAPCGGRPGLPDARTCHPQTCHLHIQTESTRLRRLRCRPLPIGCRVGTGNPPRP